MKETSLKLEEISELTKKLLISILELPEEDLSANDKKRVYKWAKTAMELIDSILFLKSRLNYNNKSKLPDQKILV